MSLYQSFKTHASLSGVSHGTREAHEVAFRDFAQWAKSEANIQIKSIDNLKVKHIEAYTKSRLNNGIKPRTLQNRMAALRVAMRNSEKEHIRALANPKHSQLSCKALGIDGASREGTKTAMSDDMLKGAFDRLENGSGRALARPDAAAALRLQAALGLRIMETVRSGKSLESWREQLQKFGKITVVSGTKGGRTREVSIHQENREKAAKAIAQAMKIAADQGGHLIKDHPDDLKGAYQSYRDALRRTGGLKGMQSPHATRYAFAQGQVRNYQENRCMTLSDALAATSLDLGHGDGRGRWVNHVYSK